MPHEAFHQGLLRKKQISGTEIHHFIETLTGNPLKYKMDSFTLGDMYGIIQQNDHEEG